MEKKDKELLAAISRNKCQFCGAPLMKVSWKVTAAAFDAGKEVEQTVYQCSEDKNFVTIEVSTGNPSQFAVSY